MRSPRPLGLKAFQTPDRAFGILPFWFLNGELDPDEMRYQLKELREKGMQGVIFHGRYGLEMPYLGEKYLDRIRLGVDEAGRLGLTAWIYDEMNWPSGTADKKVLVERPDLAQHYLECVSFSIRGPWFMCLTGEDSRYLDFQRSTPVAMFAIRDTGEVLDLTANLSFEKVVPWEVPPGEWRLCYIVEKRADYYIDALDPEATATFLRLGYEPYVRALSNGGSPPVVGFYSDEPAMHYFLTAGDNPIVPWTKEMFRRFRERNGYDLRSHLLDLFFDLRPDAPLTRHDFYNTTTEFYSDAYYRQLRDWCRSHGVVLTAHLLYEEWIRQMVRVEGNPFRHYENMDVVAVDHLYPVIGTRESPDQHVAIKLASSAAHHTGSERLICESFGGIFMDATMQRMKWIADWEYVLGVNMLNPHGFHYTFEGPRKRDWPPSMFYQYPWWRYYDEFSAYMSRTSEMLTGGRHVAKVAVVWPINAMFATYLPDAHTPQSKSIEAGLNILTDLLLRLHHDFDYLDEDVLARAEMSDGRLLVGNEDYELILVPPMAHIRATTVEALERFAASGGRVLGTLLAPRWSFGPDGMTDASARIEALFGSTATEGGGFEVVRREHGEGTAAFVTGDARTLAAAGPGPLQDGFAAALDGAIRSLIEPDIEVSDPDVFVLHRRREEGDIYFLVNTTFEARAFDVSIPFEGPHALWDPTTGTDRALGTVRSDDGWNSFHLNLPSVGSVFLVGGAAAVAERSQAGTRVPGTDGTGTIERVIEIGGEWRFTPEDPNGLVIMEWRATPERDGDPPEVYADAAVDDSAWQRVAAGAWAYQLPAEPERPWPIPVWFRIRFDVEDVPEQMSLLVDGFDGDDARIWLNGETVDSAPVRSRIDAQMQEVDLGGLVRRGTNVLAVRLLLRDPTGGIVDHVKLLGEYRIVGDDASGPRVVAASEIAEPRSWTEFGYQFFSGRGAYRSTFELPERTGREHVSLEIPMRDDVVEVEINGRKAGVLLWDPYVIAIGDLVRSGENDLTLRVANTPANLLNGVKRPSGIAGAPRIHIAGSDHVDAVEVPEGSAVIP